MQTPILQSGRSVTARDAYSNEWTLIEDALGSDILFVDDVAVAGKTSPGGVVDVEITMNNMAEAIFDPLNPDTCNPEGAISAGYEYEVIVDPSWTDSESVVNCLGVDEGFFAAGNKTTHPFSFTAPESIGEYSIDITVETISKRIGGSESFTVAVEDDVDEVRPGPGDPITDPDDPAQPGDLFEEIFGGEFSTGLIVGLGGVVLLLVLLQTLGE